MANEARREAAEMLAKVVAWYALLDVRAGHVIRERYGLVSGEPKTLAAIGHELDLTRERVRQLEHQALDELAEIRVGSLPRSVIGRALRRSFAMSSVVPGLTDDRLRDEVPT